jgi:hypothetical protein
MKSIKNEIIAKKRVTEFRAACLYRYGCGQILKKFLGKWQ